MKVIILSLLFITIYATPPRSKLLYASAEPANKGIAHIAINTGTMHAFGLLETRVFHRRYIKGHFGPINTIAKVEGISFSEAISAFDEKTGKQVIIYIFVGPRSTKLGGKCEGNITDGCKDIYITESLDDGQTWKAPTYIRRDIMDDDIERNFPALAYDRLTQMIYIVYARKNTQKNIYNLGIIKKNAFDSSFTDEAILPIPEIKLLSQPKLTITKPAADQSVMHLSFLGGNSSAETVYYAKSTNEGPWTVREVTPGARGKAHSNSLAAIGTLQDPFVYLAHTTVNDTFLLVSSDHGNSWSDPLKIHNGARIPFLRACGKTEGVGAMISLFREGNPDAYAFIYYDRKTKQHRKFDKPFTDVQGVNHLPMFDCTATESTGIVYAAVAGFKELILFAEYREKA